MTSQIWRRTDIENKQQTTNNKLQQCERIFVLVFSLNFLMYYLDLSFIHPKLELMHTMIGREAKSGSQQVIPDCSHVFMMVICAINIGINEVIEIYYGHSLIP